MIEIASHQERGDAIPLPRIEYISTNLGALGIAKVPERYIKEHDRRRSSQGASNSNALDLTSAAGVRHRSGVLTEPESFQETACGVPSLLPSQTCHAEADVL